MPGGKVWAVDVQPEMISLLQAGAKRSGLTQIEARLGAVDDVRLPGGRIAFVEYKAEDPRVPIDPLHKMSEAQIKREAAVFALDWERTVSMLAWRHAVVFRKRV